MPNYRTVQSEPLERISIRAIQPGDELVDRFRVSLGVVATVRPIALGVVSYTIKGSAQPRYLSPFAPTGKNKGTVLRVKK